MAQNQKIRQSEADVEARFQKAKAGGRWQTALDLAKQIYRFDSSEENRQTLIETYIARARQLKGEGRTNDAAAVFLAAEPILGTNPDLRIKVAQELASLGRAIEATRIAGPSAAPEQAARIQASLVDAAMEKGPQGRAILPASLQAEFDRTIKAFSEIEQGRDDTARELLQGIGLQSPFLEWKLFARGLMAYYSNDDSRAIENWSRLTSTRKPARLAAIFQSRIDPAFAASQKPEMVNRLRAEFDRLNPTPQQSLITLIRRQYYSDACFPGLTAIVEQVVRIRPPLPTGWLERFRECMYWKVAKDGCLEDAMKLQSLLGPSQDDVESHRLDALGAERDHDPSAAQVKWAKFEQWLSTQSDRWAPRDLARARAQVFLKMAEVANGQTTAERLAGNLPTVVKTLLAQNRYRGPSERECLIRAMETDPTWFSPQATYFHVLTEKGSVTDFATAINHGLRIFQQFPDERGIVPEMFHLCFEAGYWNELIEVLQHDLRQSPTKPGVKNKLGYWIRRRGIGHAMNRDFDRARQDFEAALDLVEPQCRLPVLAAWAATEMAAKNLDRGQELLALIPEDSLDRRVLCIYMQKLAQLLNLPTKLKTGWANEIGRFWADPPTLPLAVAIVTAYKRLKNDQMNTTGYVSKVKTYCEAVINDEITMPQLILLGEGLFTIGAPRLLRNFARVALKKFRDHPYPRYCIFRLNFEADHDKPRRQSRLEFEARHIMALIPNMEPGEERDAIEAYCAKCKEFLDRADALSTIIRRAKLDLLDGYEFDDED